MKKANKDISLIKEIEGLLKQKHYQYRVQNKDIDEQEIIYEIEPVDILTFVTSPEYLGQNLYGLSEPQKKVLEVADDFENGINYLILWVGKGGGKDWITRVIFMRLVYKLLCMRSPHEYFGLPSSEIITFLNVAASADQASTVFFEPLKNYIKNAGPKAFKQFGFDPERDIKERYILFPKNIMLISGHSESDTLEGKNILVAVADEIDAKTFRNPQKMWTMLRSSSRSRFNGREKIFAISYMRYSESNGMIKSLYEEHLTRPDSFVAKYPTWEFNPNPNITKETFKSEFEANPEEAETIYACNPPEQSIDAFIKDTQRLKNSMKKDYWPLKFPLPPEDYDKNPSSEYIRLVNGEYIQLNPYNLEFHEWFKGEKGVNYIFVADPALGRTENGGDAFAVALGHREYFYTEEGKIVPRPVIDFVFRFTGYMFPEREIQFFAVQKLIEKLVDELNFNISIFYFDIYNSASLAQWVKRRYPSSKVIYNKYVQYEHYTTLRERIYGEAPPSSGEGNKLENGGINWFYHPILYKELINLVEDRQKKKVDHKYNTTKDMADTVAILTYMLVNLPIQNPINIVGVPQGLINDLAEDIKQENEVQNKIKKLVAKKKEEFFSLIKGKITKEEI
ncbi:MAG: hypothetical protein QXX30_01480 [Candidatus Aenigmatarchaeota archaeon]